MYAVVETGGKQYRVSVGDKLKVEKLDLEEGDSLQFDKVLMVNADGDITVGEPHVAGAAVEAVVLGQGRGEKIRVVKFKRRKKYRRLQGHRQSFTELEITAIGGEGEKDAKKKKVSKKASAKKVEAKKEVAPAKAEKEAAPAKAKKEAKKEAKPAKKEAKAKEAKPAKAKKEVAKAKTKEKTTPAKAKKDAADDKLTDINGIGPVIEGKLKAMGITSFAQIAAMTKDEVDQVNDKLSFKGRIEREEWIKQAKKLS